MNLKTMGMKQMSEQSIDVFCVYGPSYVDEIRTNLLQSLDRQMFLKCRLHLINFDTNESFFNGLKADRIFDWSEDREPGRLGFGEGINYLFGKVQPTDQFIVANPDTIPARNAIHKLNQTLMQQRIGIVEAKQWPFEHPKEYDEETLQTPWATGAFFAANSTAYSRVSGFDQLFFLYNEDVDISWRMRQDGWSIIYQPDALVYHFTGLGTYQKNVYYREHFYSLRNFIVICYKFWGDEGERYSIRLLEESNYPKGFKCYILNSYNQIKPKIVRQKRPVLDKWIKVVGLNQYHEMR